MKDFMNNNLSIKKIVSDFKLEKINRRDAIKRLLLAGISGPSAYIALGLMTTANLVKADNRLTSGDIQRQMDSLTRIMSSKRMLDAIKEGNLDTSHPGQRTIERVQKIFKDQDFFDQLNVEPKNLRLSLRVFENDLKNKDTKQKDLFLARVAGYSSVVHAPLSESSSLPIFPITDDQVKAAIIKDKDHSDREKFDPFKLRPNDDIGICVSYGDKICVSAGIP